MKESAEKVIHDYFAEAAKKAWEEHRIRVDSVFYDWNISGTGSYLLQVRMSTETNP